MTDTLIANDKAQIKTCCRWASKIKRVEPSQTYHHSHTVTLDSYIHRDNNQVKVTVKFDIYTSGVKGNSTVPLVKISASPSIMPSEKEEIIKTFENLLKTLKITSLAKIMYFDPPNPHY